VTIGIEKSLPLADVVAERMAVTGRRINYVQVKLRVDERATHTGLRKLAGHSLVGRPLWRGV
jgi:hypothetical protein